MGEVIYREHKPSKDLDKFIHSYWMHHNGLESATERSIVPDSFFKIVIIVQDGKVVRYFMSGLWTEQKSFTILPKATVYGCRLRILAPEYLIQEQVADILNGTKLLDQTYLNIESFDLSDFDKLVTQWETEFKKIISKDKVKDNKLRLAEILDKTQGSISASDIAGLIDWRNQQINRYLKKYLGVTLKPYLNIQKIYRAYLDIRDGKFFPEQDYYDQAHFIREVKQHTGETPSTLHKAQNDRFIQLKHINKE